MEIREEEKEEVLEALYKLEEEKKKATIKDLLKEEDLRSLSVVEILTELALDGFIKVEGAKVFLLDRGKKIGKNIYKKHIFLENLFSFIGIKEEEAHKEACKLEHVIEEKNDEKLEEQFEELNEILNKKLSPLITLKEGESGIVKLVRGGFHVMKRLQDLGVVKNSLIKVRRISIAGPVEIDVKGSSLALGRGVASKIYVEKETDKSENDIFNE